MWGLNSAKTTKPFRTCCSSYLLNPAQALRPEVWQVCLRLTHQSAPTLTSHTHLCNEPSLHPHGSPWWPQQLRRARNPLPAAAPPARRCQGLLMAAGPEQEERKLTKYLIRSKPTDLKFLTHATTFSSRLSLLILFHGSIFQENTVSPLDLHHHDALLKSWATLCQFFQ